MTKEQLREEWHELKHLIDMEWDSFQQTGKLDFDALEAWLRAVGRLVSKANALKFQESQDK